MNPNVSTDEPKPIVRMKPRVIADEPEVLYE
jgi:hypothetical protein